MQPRGVAEPGLRAPSQGGAAKQAGGAEQWSGEFDRGPAAAAAEAAELAKLRGSWQLAATGKPAAAAVLADLQAARIPDGERQQGSDMHCSSGGGCAVLPALRRNAQNARA